MLRRFAARAAILALAGCARSDPAGAPVAARPPAIADSGAFDADPAPHDARDALSDEEGLALLGAQALVARGEIRDPDAPRLIAALRDAYAELRRAETRGDPLARRRPWNDASDVLLLAPADDVTPRTALVFLHGFGGRFALPCWQMARAVAPLGAVTACPSIGPRGDWWTDEGERVVRETANALREAGFSRLVLAGLSNGGVGASRLAPRLADTFGGMILVSGADSAAAPPPGVPVLVVQGARDAMAPAPAARAYAKRTRARYVSLDAGHFAFLLRSAEAESAVRDFVADLR